jgi:hypothetical protein
MKSLFIKLFISSSIFVAVILPSLFASPAQAESVQGLNVEVYTFGIDKLPDHTAEGYELCQTDTAWTSSTNIFTNFDEEFGGIVAGCRGDFVMVHYSGYMTFPATQDVNFLSQADDGFFMQLDNSTVIDDWRLKGCGGSTTTHHFEANVSQKVDAWFYEWGGGACNLLYMQDAQGVWNQIPDSVFTRDAVAYQPSLTAPTDLKVVVDGTTAKLSWSAPKTNTPIEHYAVTWTYGGADGWGISSYDTQATISDLPENTEVFFRVRSDNDLLGVYSLYSDPVTVVMGVKPLDPVLIQAKTDLDAAQLSFAELLSSYPSTTDWSKIPEVVQMQELLSSAQSALDAKDLSVVSVLADVNAAAPALKLAVAKFFTPVVEPPVVEPPVVEPPIVTPPVEPEVPPVVPEPSPEPVPQPEVIPTVGEAHAAEMQALMEAAQEDDLVVPSELAAVPVIGAVAEALFSSINALGNLGADLTPAVRAKAQQEVVAAIIVTQIAQLATSTALAASTSAAASSNTIRRNK